MKELIEALELASKMINHVGCINSGCDRKGAIQVAEDEFEPCQWCHEKYIVNKALQKAKEEENRVYAFDSTALICDKCKGSNPYCSGNYQQPNKSAEEFLKSKDLLENTMIISKNPDLVYREYTLKDLLEEYSKESNWISVEDRLPEDYEWVICGNSKTQKSHYGRYEDNRWTRGREVTHWQPLPEPPKQ